jgi:hypothetical protein
MTSGICIKCNKEFKNRESHARFCKALPHANLPDLGTIVDMEETVEQSPKPQGTHRNLFERIGVSKPKTIEVFTPDELIAGLPTYKIKDKNPKTGFGAITNKKKDFIQVVLISELMEPKTFWAEKTGMNRIQYQDRMYKLPRDIRGNVFFWHVDKKEPLIDTTDATQSDAESSFHELQLFNMAYSVGRAAGANDLLNNLKFILLIVGFSCLLIIADILYLNSVSKAMTANQAAMIGMLNNMTMRLP